MTLLRSTGSYALRPGLDGYPAATGNTVYEARNADTATPLDATVAVRATVSLSPVGDTTCHPTKTGSGVPKPCTVAFNASVSGDTSLAWSGCCAGSTGTTGSCSVNAIKDFTCTVDAAGSGGTTSASAIATGIDDPPEIYSTLCCSEPGQASKLCPPTVLTKNDRLACFSDGRNPYPSTSWPTCSVQASGACGAEPCDPNVFPPQFILDTSYVTGTCLVQLTLTDYWGKKATRTWAFTVQ